MATATVARILDVPVEFGGVSIGEETARVGCRIERDQMALRDVDRSLCGKRLTGSIQVGGHTTGNQQVLPGMDADYLTIDGSFDVKRVGLSPKDYSFGATFSLASIDVSELAKFAKAKGRLLITEISDIPDSDGFDGDGDEGERDPEDEHPDVRLGKDRPKGTPALAAVAKLVVNDPAGRKSIFELVKHGATKNRVEKLAEALEVKTIAAFENVMASDAYWHKRVKGVGTQGVDTITDALMSFRQAYPISSEDGEPAEKVVAGPTSNLEAAYKAGCEAYIEGLNRDDCPFSEAKHKELWLSGWDATYAADSESNDDPGDVFEQEDEE